MAASSPVTSSQPPRPGAQILSSALGLSVSQVMRAYPGTDCSGSSCEFQAGRTPQVFCPGVSACDKLVLYIGQGRITGYQADLDMLDWSRSLQAMATSLGRAKTESVGSRSLGMRIEFWSWITGEGFEISYNHAYGVNVTGTPFSNFSVMITPAEKF